MKVIRYSDSMFFKCMKCGYEEPLDAPVIVKYGESRKPLITAVADRKKETCPRCGSDLSYASSHNLLFKYCHKCGYITSEYKPPSHSLPAEPRDVESWLKAEKSIAESNTVVMGYGKKILKVKKVKGDSLIKLAIINVEVASDYVNSLRPYDSVYYGTNLGVIVGFDEGGEMPCKVIRADSCVNGFLKLHFKINNILHDGEFIKIAEPVMLYDSALRILNNGDCLHDLVKGAGDCNYNTGISHLIRFNDLRYGLDYEKVDVINEVLNLTPGGFLIIEGPPGTGKTTTIAASVCELTRLDRRVLITSHTNVAVDNALERIMDLCPEAEERMIRIGHPAKVSRRIRRVLWDVGDGGRNELLSLLDNKLIFGMTLTKLAVLDLFYGLEQLSRNLNVWPLFDYVFIDEASMVPLGVAIVPIYYGLRRIILGDTRQLPPIVRVREENMGSKSILELLVNKYGSRMLTVQRRGVSELFEYISEAFYQSVLTMGTDQEVFKVTSKRNDYIDELLTNDKAIDWVNVDGHMKWVPIRKGRYEAYSAYNVEEAELALEVYIRLLEYGIKSEEIAIITTYKAQAILLMKALEKLNIEKPSIAHLIHGSGRDDEGLMDDEGVESILDLRVSNTVDSFQGREKEIVVYSMVTDHGHKALYNYTRFNVAISRAKRKLIILSSMSDGELMKLPWIHALARRGYRSTISADTVDESVKGAVNIIINELNH